jgi:hypothetical protein
LSLPQQHHLDILTHVTATDNAQNLTHLSQALDFLGQQKEWGHVWSMLEFCKIESSTSGESFQALRDKMVVMQAQQALFKDEEAKQKQRQDGYCPSYSLSQLQEAVHVLKTYGGPSFAYLDFYRMHLVRPILGVRSLKEEREGGEAFLTLVRDLRQVLYEVQRRQHEQKATQSKKKTRAKTTMATTDAATLELQEESFRDLFLAVHFTFILSTCTSSSSSIPLEVRCKVAITLLHYAPSVLPSDKAFYQAGMLLRELATQTATPAASNSGSEQDMTTAAAAAVGYKHLAFLFLNRYIDVAEAIEDKICSSSSSGGGGGKEEEDEEEDEEDPNLFIDFKPLASCTNLCQHDVTPLPLRQYLDEDIREEIKTWVLTVCTEKGSNTDSIQNVSLPTASKAKGTVWEGLFASAPGVPWCVVTGYPIHEAALVVGGGGGKYQASKKEWEVYVKGCKVCPWTGEKVEGAEGGGATATATATTKMKK